MPTEDEQLARDIRESSGDAPVREVLKTDERVLARITDGIYRQPGSAIRELISNAYDADATRVVIKTDRPRFELISIEDDGLGMSPETVAHLIRHIGGSAKRRNLGVELGLVSENDHSLSPGGRRLIGRIGIGLFSVAQLTDRFQIITKTAGDGHRTVATVVLRQFSEESNDNSSEEEYEAGRVNIWREPAVDVETHGTTVVLNDIRKETQDTLRSRNQWAAVDADEDLAPDESRNLKPPRFHIGRVDPSEPSIMKSGLDAPDSVPWGKGDTPDTAFRKLVEAVWSEARSGGVPNLKLEQIFDYYLRMVWLQLGLAIPVRYVEGHPFDIAFGDSIYAYRLSENLRIPPKEVDLRPSETFRSACELGSGFDEGLDFEVLVDDLRIERPLKFTHLPSTTHKVTKPIIFVGRCIEPFANVASELSGGPLEFSAYLMWAPKIVPTEHQGSLIRIHGSSGTLFDPTFMRYQVSEQTRLRQITCEIYVTKGLEGALNIDRESFNYAHPHVVYLTKWLHTALRRVATVQKKISAELRGDARDVAENEARARLSMIVTSAWQKQSDDVGQHPPSVLFVDSDAPDTDDAGSDLSGGYRLSRTSIFGDGSASRRSTISSVEEKLAAVVQLLAAFDLLSDLSTSELESLVRDLGRILRDEDA